MRRYDPKVIEPKWQHVWAETGLYRAETGDKTRPKAYYMVEFPYPSGDGLHVGHVLSYTALDIMSRHKRMQGYNVLYPMGFDAFGLPTENYAIKHKIAPQIATERNIANFRRQMQALGLGFDWDREINTTDPSYYKWTQWIFLQLYKKGLAYQAEIAINWCPFEKTGLANEEVVDGKHERCGTAVEKKLLKQWVLKITAYADRLIEDLKTVDYLERIAVQQINWIGRSEGAEIEFKVGDEKVTVYTTRPDTLAGATFLVLAPEHTAVAKITAKEQRSGVEAYVKKTQAESEVARQETDRAKTGVFTGAYAENPITKKPMPIWVADYVLAGYGTGAIMAVPAHDERDFAFAEAFKLPIERVLEPRGVMVPHGQTLKQRVKEQHQELDQIPFIGEGRVINSGQFNGLEGDAAKHAIIKWLFDKGLGKHATKYKLRDWVFSRQHYWGEPIPVVQCVECGIVAVPDDQLPVVLPEVERYEPTETGESPLAAITDWVNTECPKCGGKALRETDTMPNWAGSSWYFLRYTDPHNDQEFASQEALKYWMPVDLYNGGMEHTTLHLLYSRFWHKFLYDQGLVPTSEPYARRRSHGMILGPDGQKMSKSRGNVINPDHVIEQYGADALRLYEMFMGPFDEVKYWSEDHLNGVSRFIYRVWTLAQELIANRDEKVGAAEENTGALATAVDRMAHKTLKKVHHDIEDMQFNTMMSTLMEYVNFLNEAKTKAALLEPANAGLAQRTVRALVLMLAPSAPHLAEELWHELGEEGSVHVAGWPKYDPALIQDEVVTIVIQVNGKLRGQIMAAIDTSQAELEKLAAAEPGVVKHLAGTQAIKTIVVPRKLVNFVVKPAR